jgi:hypothetical protein
MQYCEQCGSTSHDEAGFCRGCGARLPGYAPSASLRGSAPEPAATRPSAGLSKVAGRSFASVPLAQPQVKNVWAAVLLALLMGPLGMIYSTPVGALVMSAASVFALFFLNKVVGWILVFLLPVVCAVWAGLAARSANSMY